ncbi:MAG TPA: glycoside hydrolase family 2 TIM barrel-domain containing protein [Verrucomicrobiae bacterium]|nr:glycoside hydrolase family 2 TIM barrel-domain containing protein [Verrucomicrobiae bacterium]
MRTTPLTRLVFLCLLFAAGNGAVGRVIESFDANWLFLKGDPSGAGQPQFDDSNWRELNVPYDWSIAGPFCETNPAGGAGAFLPTGVAWYRKHFTVQTDDTDKCVFVEFDGVMANSDVWINGYHLGHRPYGNVSFEYELTGHLNSSGNNVIAVRCDTSKQPASRWYAGSGIYRHVQLTETSPLHFAHDGIFVSSPAVSTRRATIKIETALTNESAATCRFIVQTEVFSPDGTSAGPIATDTGTIMAHGNGAYSRLTVLFHPQLWDLATPNLYSIVSKIVSDKKCLDNETNTFGIRDARFEAATGFWLNGRNFKIKGVCLHADGGAFGAAVPLDMWRQRLVELKRLGVNAIRTAHNPPAPEFLDLCDQMGFLVMDEFFDCWTVGKNPCDYHLYFDQWSHTDERDTILRDRDHPSIIIYSVGNEIHDTPHAERAKRILRGLVAVAHETDPTRPVTMALFRPNASHDYEDGLADMLDVVGQNYRENEILAAHAQKPSRKILGTENKHDRQTWVALRDNPAYAGQFLWSGIDYLGESRHWPRVGNSAGLLDRTGRPKPMAFQRQSWWSDRPTLLMARRLAATDSMPMDPGYGAPERYTQVLFADWTPGNPAPHVERVEVYSNCKFVELFLNDKSLGSQPLPADASPRIWNINYEPGTLTAIAREDNGNVVATDELRTAGQSAKIVLSTDTPILSPGFDHVAEVRAQITDSSGVEIPHANNLISFSVSGPGEIVAVDNGDNASHEPFQATKRHAYEGECVAYLRATIPASEIKVSATAGSLEPGSMVIRADK